MVLVGPFLLSIPASLASSSPPPLKSRLFLDSAAAALVFGQECPHGQADARGGGRRLLGLSKPNRERVSEGAASSFQIFLLDEWIFGMISQTDDSR